MQRRRTIGARSSAGLVTATVSIFVALAGWLAPSAFAADPSPDLTITKTSDATGALAIGDRFSYTITVANIGAATAHRVVVSDDFPTGVAPVAVIVPFGADLCSVTSSQVFGSPPAVSLYCPLDPMAPGETRSTTFEVALDHYARCGALKNVARVTASDEPAENQGDNKATALDTVTCVPSIELDTTAPAYAHRGDEVAFTMRVHNDGQTALGSVHLSGPGCSPTLIVDGNGDHTLGVGESWTLRCSRPIGPATPDPLAAAATVTARTDTDQKVTAHDGATVRILDPSLSIVLRADPISGTDGDTVTYSYLVTNTGDALVRKISVRDDHLGAIGTVPQLAPGHSATLQAQRVLSTTDVWVTNTATARGIDGAGAAVLASDEASVTIVGAAVHSGGSGNGGDGTAFTGLDATGASAAAMLLALAGVCLLAAARRRA